MGLETFTAKDRIELKKKNDCVKMSVLEKIEKDCKEIEKLLAVEPSLVFCERELQILLQEKLLMSFSEEIDFSFSACVIRPSGLANKQMKINRVFRELNLLPSLGRKSP